MTNYQKEDRVNCREISSKINARYSGNTIKLGKASHISEICICIDTRYCFPLYYDINLLIPFKRDVLSIYGRVRSITHNNTLSETISFDIINPSKEYIEYIDSFSQTGKYCQQVDNVSKGDDFRFPL